MGRRALAKEQKPINKQQRDRRRAANPGTVEKKKQYDRNRYRKRQQEQQHRGERIEESLAVREQASNDRAREDSIAWRPHIDEDPAAFRQSDELNSNAEPEEGEGPYFNDFTSPRIHFH